MSLSAGTRLGSYEILALLGTGGMGEVYRARDTRLKRDIAIKILPDAWVHDADRLARFHREAELLATLNHPNIAAIYGFEEADGVKALLLELVEGPTLADRLAQGPVPLEQALSIARQIAEGLDAAHDRGIVHRDLKPANIKVREDDAVKVLDFGLAKALGEEPPAALDAMASPTMTSPAMTRTGVILGTAAYMSPEQARGQAVDRRTDVWAFGCVLYEMLTGRVAFAGETVSDRIAAILQRDPDWSALPPSTPASLARLLRRCLQKDRKRRLRDIGDLRQQLDELEEVDNQSGTGAAAPSRWAPVLAGAAMLAGIAAIFTVLWIRSGDQTEVAVASSNLGPLFTRITSDDSFSTEPAISGDGTLVVYASDRAGGGQLDLWLQRTAGGQAIRLTDDPADDRAPAFSPDGSLVAFRSDRNGGGIYVMPALGGDARLVAERGRGPRFSPDGSRIAYWSGPLLGTLGNGTSVFVVPAIGGPPTQVAKGFSAASRPIWSPDGRSLLFFGRSSAETSPSAPLDWWWTSLEGAAPVPTGAAKLLADKGFLNSVAGNLSASSDGFPAAWTTAGVLFSARRGESINLWRLGMSERTGKPIESSLTRLTTGTGSDLLPSTDAAGRIVFQLGTEGVVSLTLPLEPNAGSVRGAIVLQSFEAGQYDGRNSLDNAGRRLAYPKFRPNESEIWVKDLTTGQNRHVLTTPRFGLSNLIISPDGMKIAYTLSEGGTVAGFIVPASGGTARKACDGCALQGWFPDSRRILALDRTDARGGHAIVVDTVDGTKQDVISDPQARIVRLDVSKDGRWLSFSSRNRVWIAAMRPGSPPPESDWVTVLNIAEGTGERACGWSPDGRLLYLLLERDGFRDLYAQRIDPTRGKPLDEPFVIQHLHDPRRRWGSTPIGTAIVNNAFVFNQVEMTGSIWLLDMGPGADAPDARPR